LLLLSLRRCASRFILLLRRTRWVLFSVFMIYAYATPGDALWPHLGVLSPVAAGVEDGLVQLLRLLVVLSGLSLLLSLMSQTQMISGLYSLFRPLRYFGVPSERAVVRLALTLDYAESALRDTADNWRGRVEQMLLPVQAVPGYIELHITPFVLRDWFMLVAVTIALFGAWL
jgi:energy-coupling factor transporter transmembrane protein EcfT